MTFSVTLTREEMNIVRILGELRSSMSRSHNVKNNKVGHLSDEEIDVDGVMAELAFCKHHNIYFDPTINPRSSTYDCLYMGKRIDVKSTRHQNGRLIKHIKHNSDVDVFVLAIIKDKNTVTFPGYSTATNLYKSENIKDIGYGDTYVIENDQLTPWKTND
jgi:hypothetical protein